MVKILLNSSTMSHSTEFIHFIKTFLINSCYIHYCKEISNLTDPSIDEFNTNLLHYKNEKYLWDNIFYSTNINNLLTYYLNLTNNIDKLDQNRLSNIYQQNSFQEYIDSMVNFQQIGYREYQKFTRSMQDINFKNNIFKNMDDKKIEE